MKTGPFRRCVGCRQSKRKDMLIRIVRHKDGTFTPDYSGKSDGRGAYLCNSISCLLNARKHHGLERSFSAKIEPAVYDELEQRLLHAGE